MESDSLTRAWAAALGAVPTDELGPVATSMLRSARPLGDIEGTILLAVPNGFTKQWIEDKAQSKLTAALSVNLGRTVRIAITVDPSLEVVTEDEEPAPVQQMPKEPREKAPQPTRKEAPQPTRKEAPQPTRKEAHSPALVSAPTDSGPTHLNPKFTFDTFVIGPSNRFAHAAALAASETPGTAFNPLFIYGDSGLGKTHLLQAIGHNALSMMPHLKVRYVNSEEFTNEFINAIRLNKTDNSQVEAFHRRYRELDILLIDDIQFIGDKEQTVEGFFHTFNALHSANKQIVLTSDLPPAQLKGFEDRMRSRFSSGLLVDVQPPDLETRIAILHKKADAEGLEVTPEVFEYVASRISSNIRELEGALVRIGAWASLYQERIDLNLAQMMLKDFVSNPDDNEITVSLIMSQCAVYFGVTIEQMGSSERSHNVVEARQIAMYLCRELTDLSLPKIGQAFGRDHTTVMHANKKISKLMKEKRETFNHVSELTNRIKQKARES